MPKAQLKTNHPRFKNIVGQKFNKLTVIKLSHFVPGQGAHWLCKCDCGKEKILRGTLVWRDYIKSCGCLHRESSSRNGKNNKTHGLSKHKLYDVHRQMVRRCYDHNCKDYKCYGSRGISICKDWMKLSQFMKWCEKSGYKDGLTIERINNDGNYKPSNCRWIRNEFQAKNTRKQRYFTFSGKRMDLSDWARETGIQVGILSGRLKRNWSVERMLTLRPIRGRNQSSS